MKRIFAVLVVLAMVFGVALVANAEEAEFCGVTVNAIDNITFSGKTATMKGASNEQGYFAIPQGNLASGDFSFEFDYAVTTCESERALNFEGRAADWFILVLPNDGKHARLEGNTETGAYKLVIDGAVKDEGTSDALKGEWTRDFKVGFTNTNRAGAFEATISNLVVNDKNAATGDVTAIIALVAVLAGGVLVFSKKH